MMKAMTIDLEPASKKECRVCLQKGNIPITSKINPLDFSLSRYLRMICDIEINPNDAYPKYLCKQCYDNLNTAIKLRKTAMRTQIKLKAIGYSMEMKKCFQETEQRKWKPDLINLLPLPKQEIKNEPKGIVEINNCDVILSSVEKEEIESDLEVADEIETTPEIAVLSPLQKKENNHELKEINETGYNPEAPILTLEQVQKFKAKDIPYDTYYEKVIKDGRPNYHCRICKKVYKKGSIADHLLTHLPDSVSQYVCENCGKTFKKFCSFYQHRIIHKNILPFECKLCPYKGRSKTLLQVHIKRVHKKEYNYQCTLCPRKFLDTNNLRYHVRRHGEPKFQCTFCQKSFYENGELKRHTQSQHIETAPQKCDNCGNLYKNRKNLLSHQIKVHKRKQIYNNRATYLKLESGVTNELESK